MLRNTTTVLEPFSQKDFQRLNSSSIRTGELVYIHKEHKKLICYRDGFYMATGHDIEEMHGIFGIEILNEETLISNKGVSLHCVWHSANLSKAAFHDSFLRREKGSSGRGPRRNIQSAFSFWTRPHSERVSGFCCYWIFHLRVAKQLFHGHCGGGRSWLLYGSQGSIFVLVSFRIG